MFTGLFRWPAQHAENARRAELEFQPTAVGDVLDWLPADVTDVRFLCPACGALSVIRRELFS
jgi:predicted RNA-binding Zn-ribbon protein involved in translation (DUF1610 family)